VPSNFLLKTMNGVHRGLLKLSGGRLGWQAGGMPVVELTTTGRKSGEPRKVMLTSPHQEGDSIVVVASRGGDPIDPAWFLNLAANPAVKVAFNGRPVVPMHAHIAEPDERARLWPIVTEKQPRYATYQTKTTREIPLVVLLPTERPGGQA
jgi:deazaflavin-dependent oxidoreductase (nitroreductase family)